MGYDHNDAYSAYVRMGRPATLSLAQLNRLRSLTTDTPKLTDLQVRRDSVARSQMSMRENNIVMSALLGGVDELVDAGIGRLIQGFLLEA